MLILFVVREAMPTEAIKAFILGFRARKFPLSSPRTFTTLGETPRKLGQT